LDLETEIVINFGGSPDIDDTKLAEGVFMFVGLKNSSDIIRDYTIKHRGTTVTNTL
jgi:hypothetical protein